MKRMLLALSVSLVWVMHIFIWCPSALAEKSLDKSKSSAVWVVFFSAEDCPHCEKVKSLLDEMKQSYPVHLKLFDVEREPDNKLFRSLEAIHAPNKFSVPVVILGEAILVGEKAILKRLPNEIKKYARTGGVALPYLGPVDKDEKETSKCDCEQKGKPPEISDELRRLRSLLKL